MEGFLRQKNPLGIRLLEIYKKLSISKEIFELQNQLGSRPVAQRTMVRGYASGTAYRTSPRARKYSSPGRKIVIAAVQSQAKSMEEDAAEFPSKSSLLKRKRELAKKNIRKGFYNEAWKNIEDALAIDPKDVEAITLKAKIKTLQ